MHMETASLMLQLQYIPCIAHCLESLTEEQAAHGRLCFLLLLLSGECAGSASWDKRLHLLLALALYIG